MRQPCNRLYLSKEMVSTRRVVAGTLFDDNRFSFLLLLLLYYTNISATVTSAAGALPSIAKGRFTSSLDVRCSWISSNILYTLLQRTLLRGAYSVV